MSKPRKHTSIEAAIPSGVVAHTVIRLRGEQNGDVTVYHAGTPDARVALRWGSLMMTFYSAEAAQGVLEGFATARNALAPVPDRTPHLRTDPYDQPAIAVEWTRRPTFAVVPRSHTSAELGTTVKWADLFMGPVTFQILDRAAFRSAVELLRRAHRTAVAVCLDGAEHVADPTVDDYRPE